MRAIRFNDSAAILASVLKHCWRKPWRVRLVLGDKGEAIDCPSCEGHVTTMGELLDATIEQVAALLLKGLKSKVGH